METGVRLPIGLGASRSGAEEPANRKHACGSMQLKCFGFNQTIAKNRKHACGFADSVEIDVKQPVGLGTWMTENSPVITARSGNSRGSKSCGLDLPDEPIFESQAEQNATTYTTFAANPLQTRKPASAPPPEAPGCHRAGQGADRKKTPLNGRGATTNGQAANQRTGSPTASAVAGLRASRNLTREAVSGA